MAIGDSFNQSVDYYDSWVKKALPCFDELFSVAVECIPYPAGQHLKVLDLGAGTGLFSWQVHKVYPGSEFTLIDLADQMLDLARQRFSQAAGSFRCQVADYRETLPADKQDLIISSLSIHHLAHQDKQALFKKVHGLLKPGGAFINLDQIKGPDEHFQKLYWDTWLSKVRQRGASEEQIQASIKRRRELDQDATMFDQLSWLKEAGFERVDCLYHHYFLAVFFAQKTE